MRLMARQAMELNLEMGDAARIHETALDTLEVSSIEEVLVKRAEVFFAEFAGPKLESL